MNLRIALALIAALTASTVSAAERTFPFTAAENCDGARYVWFMFEQAGFPYSYLPAAELQSSPRFKPSPDGKPQLGDVAWWKSYVAIYEDESEGDKEKPCTKLLTAEKSVCLDALEKTLGSVLWLRYDIPE